MLACRKVKIYLCLDLAMYRFFGPLIHRFHEKLVHRKYFPFRVQDADQQFRSCFFPPFHVGPTDFLARYLPMVCVVRRKAEYVPFQPNT